MNKFGKTLTCHCSGLAVRKKNNELFCIKICFDDGIEGGEFPSTPELSWQVSLHTESLGWKAACSGTHSGKSSVFVLVPCQLVLGTHSYAHAPALEARYP